MTMGLFTKDIKTFDDLFVHGLKDIYYAEQQIAKALPKMIGKTTDPQLKSALELHLQETKGQIGKVEEVFRLHQVEPKGVKCEAIEGIISEGEHDVGEVADTEVRDAAILAAAQAVEHYEIARYGTLAAWARRLGREDCASILHQILEEEKRTDEKLSQIAKTKVNVKVA
jgi:ferritin-like metal-binding protein YciE